MNIKQIEKYLVKKASIKQAGLTQELLRPLAKLLSHIKQDSSLSQAFRLPGSSTEAFASPTTNKVLAKNNLNLRNALKKRRDFNSANKNAPKADRQIYQDAVTNARNEAVRKVMKADRKINTQRQAQADAFMRLWEDRARTAGITGAASTPFIGGAYLAGGSSDDNEY